MMHGRKSSGPRLMGKLWQVNWTLVLLIGTLASIGVAVWCELPSPPLPVSQPKKSPISSAEAGEPNAKMADAAASAVPVLNLRIFILEFRM